MKTHEKYRNLESIFIHSDLEKTEYKSIFEEKKEDIYIKNETFFNLKPKKKIDKYYLENNNLIYFEKNKLETYIKKDINKINLSNILSNNFNSLNISKYGFNFTRKDSAAITADNIGEFALPIAEYIHRTQPDYVVVCDRGARMLGLAVFRLYNELYGRFPTTDGTMRFRRFSKRNSDEETEKHVKPLIEEITQSKEKPTVLVLDDWVVSGATKEIVHAMFNKFGKGKVDVKFGVLAGKGADVSGDKGVSNGFAGLTDWRDDSNIIGVQYGDGNFSCQGTEVQPVRSEMAREYRRRMYDGIDKLLVKLMEREAVTL